MKSGGRITIVRRKFGDGRTRRRGGSPLYPHRVDVVPGERSPHSFPESCAQQCAQRERLRVGAPLNDVYFSGEDENLRAYYHREKNFFRIGSYGPTSMHIKDLAIQTRITKIGDAFYQPPLRRPLRPMIPTCNRK